METINETPTKNYLISWTESGSNNLKAYELVTSGLDVKLKMKGEHFTEWFEAVATHANKMGMNSLFEYGPNSMISSLVHDEYAAKSPSLNIIE